MLNQLRLTDRLPLIAVSVLAFTCVLSQSAAAQIKALRNGDDQYVQSLREQGMSDLLQRFVESDPPEDPIARLALDVALKEFVASDLLARAAQANQAQDYAQVNALFQESRATFEGVLAAQRQLIKDYPDDERMPIWQTDFAQMVIELYLPRYFQDVIWHYEYGLPNDEQKAVYEAAMIEALQFTADAANRLDLLPGRLGRVDGLRAQLEEDQIWFKLQDYTSINTPYWLGHAAHGVSILPDDHEYFKNGNMVRGQHADAKREKDRLRSQVNGSCGPLSTHSRVNETTKLNAKLLVGKTFVWSKDFDDIEDGVEQLDEVIAQSPGTYHGYLASLSKAVGRWNSDELDITEAILNGMGNHEYVRNDPTVLSRLLAADLHFRILTELAKGEPAKIAEAYNKAYIPLIDSDDARFKQMLFTRWAQSVDDEVDPAALPAMVRMGIGEQLTNQGAGLAQIAVQASMQVKPAIPAELEQWNANLATQIEEAKGYLNRALKFNGTLTGNEIEAGPVLARGLFNTGTCQYWLAELEKVLNGGKSSWQPFFVVAKSWLSVAQRVPDADKAEEAISFAINLLLNIDLALNKESIREPEVRVVYKEAFELINERWPQSDAAHNNRLYAGFNLYEKVGALEMAAKVYGALPNTHRDYFQAKRQMVYALHRNYRGQSDRLRLMVATKPLDNPPDGQNPAQILAFNEKKLLWQKQHDALVEDITRQREMIIEEAELVVLDAKDEAENARETDKRFAAATALGACQVVLAGMEADQGNTDKAMEMLQGFEDLYSKEDGEYADLAALQANPDGAKQTLQGLVQSAQEQRILTLLDAKRTSEMSRQAKEMMEQSPDVAAAVINGVLMRIRAEIDREKRAIEAAAFELQRKQADERIKFYADAAVSLGELLVQWAEGQGFDQKKMSAYQMPLAESLMLADQEQEAVKIMEPILELYPNTFSILIRTGRAHLAVYKKTRQPENYESAMGHFAKVVKYYNQQPTKPAPYWEAWLGIIELMDAAGGDPAKTIPERARMLYGVDENLGGPDFKEDFELLFQRNGGVERLQPAPGVLPDQDGDQEQSLLNRHHRWPGQLAIL